MPAVSVIVPVYNTGKYLSKCLDSLIAQTLSDIEIICINDCSTDNSLEILERYAAKDNRIKIINFTENKGVSVARNTGIDVAEGEYIGFVDSDDFVDLDFYEKIYKKAVETGADISKGDLKEHLLSGKTQQYDLNSLIKKYDCKFFFLYTFSAGIYRLNLIRKYGIKFMISMPHGEDLLFLNENIRHANKVSVAEDTFYHYDRREDSADCKFLDYNKILSATIIYKKILDNINKCSIPDIAYNFIVDWLLSAGFGLIVRNPETCCKEMAINLLFYVTEEAHNKNYIYNYFRCKFPYLYDFIVHPDKNGFMNEITKYATTQQLICAGLRYNLKNRKG